MTKVELPDFDEMQELINDIRTLSIETSKLDLEIEYREALTFREGKDKGLATNYVENAWKVSGFNDEILPLRVQLAEKQAELTSKRFTLELYKNIIETWRTVQANERLGIQ